ncbi:MAG: hypothetical protein JWP97_4100 [Labilithrix sp.]|nr:hypothetical protein [Labilithrix sp.]
MPRPSSLVMLSFGACLLAGCGNAGVRAAERGDQARLRSEIQPKHQRGTLGTSEAADLAEAVATREIATAKDDAAATARIRESLACAPEIDDALGDRMKKHDGAGAEAALLRLEDGKLGEGSARDYLSDGDDRWRAVATRTLHRGDDAPKRRAAMLDPSPRVRRSAIRAAADARDAGDLDVLFETARVDPEPLLRNEAVRAATAILRESGDRARAATQANRLRDLWTAGDDAIREDVAVAWSFSPVFESGGREALRVELAAGRGPGAIAAAAVVVRSRSGDKELAASASALLARTIAEGSRRDRSHAIASARVTGAELEALRKAAHDDDGDVRVPALARLLESKPDHDAAIKDLEALAGQGLGGNVDGRALETATRARLALAYAGDLRIQAWIERDLASPEPSRRLAAASALAALGRPGRAAVLLADADVSVRTRAACTILVAARR